MVPFQDYAVELAQKDKECTFHDELKTNMDAITQLQILPVKVSLICESFYYKKELIYCVLKARAVTNFYH